MTSEWETLLKSSSFVRLIESSEFDQRLFALYMVETYHYTLHNARNQAVVGVRAFNISPQYLNFCFDHAAEEAGHELMAIHDLRKMGYDVDIAKLPRPLPATEHLIAYLYWMSATGNPLQRLGYSFWAETSYGYINPIIQKIKSQLKLADSQMTFFIAHSAIDAKHAEEVERMVATQAKTESDYADIEHGLVQSLRLTGRMLEEVATYYKEVSSGKVAEPYPLKS